MNFIFILLISFVLGTSSLHIQTNDYEYWCYGNCKSLKNSTKTLPGTILMGGGTDVDDAYRWLSKRCGGGDVVVLRASGTDAYNPYLYDTIGGFNSASTILFNSRSASSDPVVLDFVRNACGIYFAGGDQWEYWQFWKDTPLQTLLRLLSHTKTIGGTSAGCAVQPGWVFTAQYGSAYSNECLANPYNKFVTLGRDFLNDPLLLNVITDTHFEQRDRMGRSLTFLARILMTGANKGAFAISINQATALLIDEEGTGSVVTMNESLTGLFFLHAKSKPEVCKPNVPLSFSKIDVWKANKGDQFFLKTWSPKSKLESYTLSVLNGTIISSNGKIYG